MSASSKTICIIGGGPAACTLAILLKRADMRVIMFHEPRKAPILVGESLVPAVIPILRDLGVEEEVSAYSLRKPGASFLIDHVKMDFVFDAVKHKLPPYAYNVPRDRFDDTLMKAVRASGTIVVQHRVSLNPGHGAHELMLDEESIAATKGVLTGQPDMIIDAAGRVRLAARTLNISARKGARTDVALFAHVDKTEITAAGHVHTDKLERGWSWRIPLPDRVSLGMVVPDDYLANFGHEAEGQYDRLLREDPVLQQTAPEAKRITPVMRYSNYQLISDRIVGKGWAMTGDSAGFVDPVFSSGLFLSMDSSIALSKALINGSDGAMKHYADYVARHLAAWQQLISHFYDGRLFTSFLVGDEFKKNILGKMISPHISKHMGQIFMGSAALNPYSRGLLEFLVKYGLRGHDPSKLSIR